jgi:hypothetical protein
VKWTPGRLALVTAAVLVTLVAVGVGYVVHQDSGTVSNPPPTQTTPVPSQTPSAGASPSPALPTLVPGNPLTITAKPSPTKKPPKKRKPHKKPEPPPVLEFRLTTFNMLGSSHTASMSTIARMTRRSTIPSIYRVCASTRLRVS